MSTVIRLISTQDMSKVISIQGDLIPLTKQQLMKRALKKSGLFFGLAMASIFIPVFHFVLVPALLIISAISFFKEFSPTYFLKIESTSTCVQCAKPLQKDYVLKDDHKVTCGECHCRYILENKEA